MHLNNLSGQSLTGVRAAGIACRLVADDPEAIAVGNDVYFCMLGFGTVAEAGQTYSKPTSSGPAPISSTLR